ncbi:Hypothetical protein NTJ_11193 [Nesidiocoris tenuis]|uniref:Uncharacterized protein n=1 Tax=Nesidiocoris tenuis TaxID=355587 RepID=A0ABN7B2A3_9HEMI|nr:Hypothetical protein NTJ_11193 [Nesidiocoris tenuis]
MHLSIQQTSMRDPSMMRHWKVTPSQPPKYREPFCPIVEYTSTSLGGKINVFQRSFSAIETGASAVGRYIALNMDNSSMESVRDK